MNHECWAKLYEKVYWRESVAHPFGDAIQNLSHSILERNVETDIENH